MAEGGTQVKTPEDNDASDTLKDANLPLPKSLEDHIYGTIYGNCIGDAIGLLSEFMTKEQAEANYKKYLPNLEYDQKIRDNHRIRWKKGDWTDDSDQMILIMMSLIENKKVNPADFGKRLKNWAKEGFPELGDKAGMGIGHTTHLVLTSEYYDTNPHKAAKDVWKETGCQVAPNGAVMRTSILGVYNFNKMDEVVKNTLNMCKVTHHDPRCQASCVAVTVAISLMLQAYNAEQLPNIDDIIAKSYKKAKEVIPDDSIQELNDCMLVENLSDLNLCESGKIGYTYKTLGSGFWALKQDDFQQALTSIVMEGGDADTNGAVAGALLGCKLGANKLPRHWVEGLCHKYWLDEKIQRFLQLINQKGCAASGFCWK